MRGDQTSRQTGNIVLLYAISFFSAFYFYLPVLTIYFQQRGLNFLQINSLTGLILGTLFLAEVPTGIIADRIGRKNAIIVSLGLQLLGELIFIVARSYWQFALSAIIAGLGFAFASGCVEALLYDTLKQIGQAEAMKKVSGAFGAFKTLAFTIGPLIGGFLAADLSLKRLVLLVVMTAGSVSIALVISFFLQEPEPTGAGTRPNSVELLRDGVILFRKSRSLQRIVLLGLFATPFSDYLVSLYQPYFVSAGVPSVWLGIAFSGGALLAMGGSKYAYLLDEKLGIRRGAFLANALPGLLYLLLAGSVHPVAVVSLFMLNRGSMSLREPLLADYRNLHISSHNRATVLSLISAAAALYVALLGLLIGFLADHNLRSAFVFMGFLVLCGTIIFHLEEQDGLKAVWDEKPD